MIFRRFSVRSSGRPSRVFNDDDTIFGVGFKGGLHSRFYQKTASKKGFEDHVFAEGVVFYNLKRKAAGHVFMAKLRRDMFDWFYAGIEIFGYDKKGRDEIEEQEKFD